MNKHKSVNLKMPLMSLFFVMIFRSLIWRGGNFLLVSFILKVSSWVFLRSTLHSQGRWGVFECVSVPEPRSERNLINVNDNTTRRLHLKKKTTASDWHTEALWVKTEGGREHPSHFKYYLTASGLMERRAATFGPLTLPSSICEWTRSETPLV